LNLLNQVAGIVFQKRRRATKNKAKWRDPVVGLTSFEPKIFDGLKMKDAPLPARPRWFWRLIAYDLSQQLQQLRQSLLKPNRMMMIEMETHMVLSPITSRLTSSATTPIRMMNTPGILSQMQQRFLVSQQFFSPVGSMVCSFRFVV
jgi:hypothetical protein